MPEDVPAPGPAEPGPASPAPFDPAARPRMVHVNPPPGGGVVVTLLERSVLATLDSEGQEHGEISVTLLPDEPIRELNRRYLGHDRTTDVISFALHDEGEPPLGDVYIGVEQARRQAKEVGVPLDEELVRLVIHGTLHVLGYDHPEAPEARAASEQYRRQEALVARVLRGESP